MENRHHQNGIMGFIGMGASGLFHWIAQHADGLTHAASVAGVWLGFAVSAISFVNLIRGWLKKRKGESE